MCVYGSRLSQVSRIMFDAAVNTLCHGENQCSF